MASFTLQLIPATLDHSPSQEQQSRTATLLATFVSWGDVETRNLPKPQLATSGAAFESLTCPHCRIELDRFGSEEHDEWWHEMEAAIHDADDPLNEAITMPCCGGVTKAGAFDLGEDAILARCLLKVDEYELHGGKTLLNDEQMSSLANLFGIRFVQIVEAG